MKTETRIYKDVTGLVASQLVTSEKDIIIAQNCIYGDGMGAAIMPKVVENREDEVYLYQIGKFIEIMNAKNSDNPFNDYSIFKDTALLDNVLISSADLPPYGICPLRKDVIGQGDMIKKYIALLTVSGWLLNAAIIYDRDWNIIDGLNRYYAILALHKEVKDIHIIRMDFGGKGGKK